MGVPIHSRSESGLGVIEMESQNPFQANQAGYFADRGIPAFRCADIVAGGEKMRRIETNTQSFRSVDAVDNRGQVSDLVAQATALSGGVFKRNTDLRFLCRRKNLVQTCYDLVESG